MRIYPVSRALNGSRLALIVSLLIMSATSPAHAQYACTTNYCIRSQSVSVQTPPEWPAVPMEPCCQTHWGALPGGIDWTNAIAGHDLHCQRGICLGIPELRRSEQSLAGVSLGLLAAQNRNRCRLAQSEGLSLRDAKRSDHRRTDGTCAQYSNQPGKVTNWWVYELKEPKRGSYVFTANVSFQKGDKGYYAVLNGCKLEPPPATAVQ